MSRLRAALLAVCVLLASAHVIASEDESDEPVEVVSHKDVITLTASNFDDTVNGLKEGESLFVKFYAPWCSHCTRLAPTFAKAATAMVPRKSGRIDCVEHKPLCSRFGVRGYPTLMLVRNEGGGVHNVYDFSGERDVPGMQAFVQDGGWKSVTPSVFPKPGETLETTLFQDIASFVRGNPSMVVLYCIILFAVIGGCCFLLWDASTIESSSAGPKPPAKSAKEKD